MKTLSELIIDQRLNDHLINDLFLGLECMLCYYRENSVYEYHGRFQNYEQVIRKIGERVIKEIDNSSLEECDGKSYLIDCSDYDSYCKKVNVTIEANDAVNDIGASFSKYINDTIYITLFLNPSWRIDITLLCGAILHELIHAYDNDAKLSKGLPSLFDELSEEYIKCREHLHKTMDPEKAMVTLKYYLDPHERNAFFGAMIKDIEHVVKTVKPTHKKYKLKEVKDEMMKITSWSRYFDFCKFALELDSYSNQSLEKAYYYAVTSSEEQRIKRNEKIEKLKRGEKPDKEFVKSASEIRKEVKAKYKIFIRKFNQMFPKVYYDYLESLPKTHYEVF